jgi:hypothetical protein
MSLRGNAARGLIDGGCGVYVASIVLLMLVFPLTSVLIEMAARGSEWLPLIAKWFVFWPVGVRLFLAGVRQTFQPQFTAEAIFGIKEPAATPIVREVGFGNLSMGALALASLLVPAWVIPAALVGGLYYGLAGLGHALRSARNAKENAALISDVLIAILLLALVAAAIVQRQI